MAGSYKKIDYRLRPAKHVERSLFAECFKKSTFHQLDGYQYVGMGSLYFSDFRLFHKALGISKLISIELNKHHKERFDFNKPFSCIQMMYGHTNTELQKIDWSGPALVWMDYDNALSAEMITDVRFLFRILRPGSFFAISVNATALHNPNDQQESGLDRLSEAVGRDRVPVGLKPSDLGRKGTSDAYRTIIIAEIESALNLRNQSNIENRQVAFEQVFHIRYADGAPMLTIAGFLLDSDQVATFNNGAIVSEPYYRSGAEHLSIDVPTLTSKEVLELERIAPLGEAEINEFENPISAPEKDVKNYLRNYRFLPSYLPVDLS